MHAPLACPVPIDAARPLAGRPPITALALRRALSGFRLPSYDWIAGQLGDLTRRVPVLRLWANVFSDPAPRDKDSWDLQIAFVQRVSQELFPVDLERMDSYATDYYDYCEESDDEEDPPESVLDYPLPILGLGIPWEVAGLDDLSADQAPLVAVLAPYLPIAGKDRNKLLKDVAEWWAGKGVSRLVWETPSLLPKGQAGLERLRDGLRAQLPPLDGLADLVSAVLKDTGNPFIDHPSGAYEPEYGDFWDEWGGWDSHTIADLAATYAKVRPAVERIHAYYEWFDGEKDEQHVIDLLLSLASGRWRIENGSVVYDSADDLPGALWLSPEETVIA